VEVELIASRPDGEAIIDLLDRQLSLLDTALLGILDSDGDLQRIVFEYSDGKCTLRFGVRRDCVPMFPVNPKTTTRTGASKPCAVSHDRRRPLRSKRR
jgi:hypothetical protein